MIQLNVDWLSSPIGLAITKQASGISDTLKAAAKLRSDYPDVDPELIRQAITQAALRAKANDQNIPESFLLTDDGLQQGTRAQVAKYRAQFILKNFGKQKVVDLTCGLGFDSYYLAQVGHKVTAIEQNKLIAEIAKHNLPEVDVICASAEEFKLTDTTNLVFVDPARRNPKGAKNLLGQAKRIMNPSGWSPSWDFVTELAQRYSVIAKVAPGMPEDLIGDWDAYWISSNGDLVETMLVSGGSAKRVAVLLNNNEVLEISGGKQSQVKELGKYLVIPNPALIRASALDYLVDLLDAGLVNEHIAWLTTSNEKAFNFKHPSALVLQIERAIKFNERDLGKWVSESGAGSVTIMTRGISIDPELLRKKLLKNPVKGGYELVVAIFRDDLGPMALLCRRLTQAN